MEDFQKYAKLAQNNNLPEGFTEWSTKNETGWTIAHEYAKVALLPQSFTNWSLVDNRGITVAQVVVSYENIPPHFDGWDIKLKDGRSVKQLYNAKLARNHSK